MTYAAGGGAAVISLVSTLTLGTGGYAALAAYAIPVTVLASLPSQRWRSTVLAVGAAFVATFTNGETVPLWLGVAALVFGSVAEDLRSVPWVGWAGGVLGSMLALLLGIDGGSPTLVAFFGVRLRWQPGTAAAGPAAHAPALGRGEGAARAGPPGWSSGPAWPASCTTWWVTT